MANYTDFFSLCSGGKVAYPKLRGSVCAEVAVIGGGLAGLSVALDLSERPRSVLVLERRSVGWGASGRNGGDLSPGFSASIADVSRRCGATAARELFGLTQLGHSTITEWIDRYSVRCDAAHSGSLRCSKRGSKADLERYCDLVRTTYGLELEVWSASRVAETLHSDRYAGAIFNPVTISLNPLDLIFGLARAVTALGGRVFEQTSVNRVSRVPHGWQIESAEGTALVEHVVFACGGYPNLINRQIWAATVPVSTFIAVTERIEGLLSNVIKTRCPVSDLDDPPNYYRMLPGGQLMWGGRDSISEPPTIVVKALLKKDMAAIFPQLRNVRIDLAWGGRIAFLRHFMPFVGEVGKNAWCATGFGGLGLAASGMAGRLIGGAIVDTDDRWKQFGKFGLPFAGGPSARFMTRFGFLRKALTH